MLIMVTRFTANMDSLNPPRFTVTVEGLHGDELNYLMQEMFMFLLEFGYEVGQDFSKPEGAYTIKGGNRTK